MTVLCLVERDADAVSDASQRALALASALAGSSGEDLAAVVFDQPGANQSGLLAALACLGAADLHVIESVELTSYAPVAWARSLAGLIGSCAASAVVAAATDRGAEVMAHLGAMTGLPVAANCVSASRTAPGACQLVRHRWAGSLLEDAVLQASPALLSVAGDAPAPEGGGAGRASGAGGASEAGGASGAGRAGEATRLHRHVPELAEADLNVRAAESAAGGGGVSLATARVVVGGGRGVGGPEGFAPLEELAGLLGAAVGVSRVVTSQGWRPHRQQVGQTGTRIAPDLYLACGISGAIQHMAGCQSAKHIVAVNTDPQAPIISHADYAVIGDLSQVIPALVDALRSRSSPS